MGENNFNVAKKNKVGKKMTVKIIAGIVGIAVVVGAVFGARYFLQLREYKKRIESIKISDVDMSKIGDGTYKGSYDAIFVGADIEVAVKNHAIENINIINHKNERGKKAEQIIDKIVSAQSLKVDTISGATNSSKVLIKAVENALESAKQQ